MHKIKNNDPTTINIRNAGRFGKFEHLINKIAV